MESGDARPHLPDGLLAALRADPTRAPEQLALAAADRHGPAAAEWVASHGGRSEPHDLARQAKRSHARLARFGGAATGVGGIVTVVPDLALLLWIQSRMVFLIAAAHGYDPRDRMRPAELLVLWDLFDDPQAARAALDGAAGPLAVTAATRRLDRGSEERLADRLMRAAARHGVRRLGGRLIPGFAVLVNSIGNERSTRALADDAIRFYGG
ncbi:MAG TPA: EcsC family protein [Solirubrobacteraceae bacterium]|nr:EcsC family protein [Solirubrobacteraceae bacterium]